MQIHLVHQSPSPVIGPQSPAAAEIKYGFEGGRVIRSSGAYHLFSAEIFGDPRFVKMRLAHWRSADGSEWKRLETLRESSGNFDGTDPRAALWAPMPIYDHEADRWNLFYTAYKSKPNSPQGWFINHEGRIWRAVSTVQGVAGLDGPYEQDAVILEPSEQSDPWEGLQGTSSFFPYKLDSEWYAFYGSAQAQNRPCTLWGVGLVRSPHLAGPWVRRSDLNPVLMDPKWVENPIVSRLPDGTYICVFDTSHKGLYFGYATSSDGVHWNKAQFVELHNDGWVKICRTPLGLLPRDDGTHDVFFTGRDRDGYYCVGHAIVRLTQND